MYAFCMFSIHRNKVENLLKMEAYKKSETCWDYKEVFLLNKNFNNRPKRALEKSA